MSAATSGFVSGAAQGAATGASIGGPWGALIGGVAGGVLGLVGGSAQDAEQANREAWAAYNNQMSYRTTMRNLEASMAITDMNVNARMAAARMDANSQIAVAEYNMSLIATTTDYNNSLLAADLRRVWKASDLELEQLEMYAARERGSIEANQAASGTVMGEGSNADVIIDQKTLRAMDAAIIQHNADIATADILNSMAKSTWEGQRAIEQTAFNGKMGALRSFSDAAISSSVEVAQAGIGNVAGGISAFRALESGESNIALDRSQFETTNTNNMISGLLQGASTAAGTYYNNKVPGSATTVPRGYTNLNNGPIVRGRGAGSSLLTSP